MRAIAGGKADAGTVQLSEILGALSHALDLTEGQPPAIASVRPGSAPISGRQLGLPETELWELYHTVMLKDLGCSSNAARICELYLSDDLSFKRDFKTVSDSLPKVLGFVFTHTASRRDWRNASAPCSTSCRTAERSPTT